MRDGGSDDLPLLGPVAYDVYDESSDGLPLLGHVRELNLLNLHLNRAEFQKASANSQMLLTSMSTEPR